MKLHKIQSEIDLVDGSLFTLTRIKHTLCDFHDRRSKLEAEFKTSIDAIIADDESQMVPADLISDMKAASESPR